MAVSEEFSPESGRIVDRILAHKRNLAERLIEVPEWGASADEPLEIYVFALSAEDAQVLYDSAAGKQWLGYMEAIVRFARDEDGKRLFKRTQLRKLMRGASREVVERVGSEIIRHYNRTELLDPLEEVTKNSVASREP